MSYTHGGDILTAQDQWGGEVLDFSANLNPLGMPQAVRHAAVAAVAEAHCYPDPYCRALTAGIAAHDGVAQGQIICGNGAADIIFRLVQALAPRRALVTAPTFSEYGAALAAAGCEVREHLLLAQEQFDLTEKLLPCITEDLDILFLCTPNNPTGRLVDRGLLLEILARCATQGVRLVVDECFLPFTEGGVGLADQLERYPNLLLLRAFTKSYAMAGLRLGYGLTSDQALLEGMTRCAQPWSVSTIAQAAGLAALGCGHWVQGARALLAVERPRLRAGLEALGLTVWDGAANYLLFCAPAVTDLKERLVQKGILIRACGNYTGLGQDYYRICVRTDVDNGRLLAALGEVLA